MKVPTCPEHETLVLDLARGRLNDADAIRAEIVLESCPVCAEWWNTTFADPATAQVDAAVAEAFAGFSRVSGRRRGWLAAAAAAVLAVGIGTTTMLWQGGETAPVVAEQGGGAVLSVWDFEDGELSPVSAATTPTASEPGDTENAVFVNDLESGDLGAWTSHS